MDERSCREAIFLLLSTRKECAWIYTAALVNAGRTDDIIKAADDLEYREQLLKDFAVNE